MWGGGQTCACEPAAKVKSDKASLAEAMTAAEDCRALYKVADYTAGEAQAVITMALLKSLSEEGGEVLPLAKEARELFKSANDAFGEGCALRLIVEAYTVEDNLDQALEHADALVDLRKSCGQRKKQSEAMVKVAQIYYQKDNINRALEVAGDARALAKEASDPSAEANACLLVAHINFKLMSLEELPEKDNAPKPPSYIAAHEQASKAIKDAMLLAGKAHSESLRGSALLARAQMAVETSMHKEALRAGSEADKIFGKVSEFSNQVRAKILVANVYMSMKEQSKASDMAKAALELANLYQDDSMDVPSAQEALDKIDGVTRKVVTQDAAPLAVADAAPGAVATPALEKAFVQEKLAELVANAAAADEPIDGDTPLMDAGIDSLASVQLVNEMSREFGLTIAPSAVFDFPTMTELVGHVIEESSG